MSESLKDKTAKGLFWGAMNSGSTQVLNLVFGIVLGRMLSPEIYSIVAILTIFTAIAGDLQSSGFTQALVNIKKPTDRDYNSVFSFNVCMSVTMYAILFFCAPLIADFYNRPCLTEVSRVLFLAFLISSLGIAHGGYMTKNMMNKEIAIIGFLALVSSGTIGIVLAFTGFTYWALVWQQIAYITVINIGRYFYVKDWRPKLTLDFGPVKEMAPFAMKILVTKIVNTISNNILTNIFGKLFPDNKVGEYSQAYKWDTMANSLVANTVGQVAQVVMVEAPGDAEDTEQKALRVFRKMMRFTCFLSMPIMLGMALVSTEFMIVTLGYHWVGCAPLLCILCFSGAFVPIYTLYQNLAISKGRSDIFMWLNIGQIACQIGIIFVFYKDGMRDMVTAYSWLVVLWLLPWYFLTHKLINYRFIDFLKDVLPFFFAALAVMLITEYITREFVAWLCVTLNNTSSLFPNITLLISRIIVAAILYYATMKILRVEILKECESFVLKKIRK